MAVGYRDYYDALGVSREASTDEIRTAYRRLAREHHPDVNKSADAGDRFKEISEAYEVLRDEEKRRAYDRFGENWKAGQDVSGAAGFGGGGRGGGARGAGGGGFGGRGAPQGFQGFSGFGTDAGGDTDFSDFFESLFGGGRASSRAGGRRRRGAEQDFSLRGSDQEAAIELTLEEAFSGGTRRFQLDGRDYEVTIPPGVREGQRIRLAGEGGPGVGGGPNGDLFLRVHILPHPRFRLKGRDVEVELPVAPWEAALGATVPVRLLDGSTAQVKVRPGSSSGVRLRLKGEGWPEGGGRRGDLHAVVKIMVPRDLTKREHDLFEQLAEVSDFDPRAET